MITIPLVVLIGFLLIKASPIDQIERLIDKGEFSLDNQKYKEIYEKTARLHKLDLPYFYFSVNTSNYKESFYDLILPQERSFYRRFLRKGYSYHSIEKFHGQASSLFESAELAYRYELGLILNDANIEEITTKIQSLENLSPITHSQLQTSYNQLLASKSLASKLIPKVTWHGKSNQYHLSLVSILQGDLGTSMRDGQSVLTKIWQRFLLTLLMIVMAFFSCYPFAIWLGKKMHIQREKSWTKLVEGILFSFSSIPQFWLATMALVFFTTPEYGKWLNIFPSVSNFDLSLRDGFWLGIFSNIKQLILPILCIIIIELAIVVRQVRSLLEKETELPYITTAVMKGLPKEKVIKKHAYKSARIQMITMMSYGITSALAGSVVIEFIFNIPGMGRLLLDSINNSDWPVLLGIILLTYIIASLIILISDIIIQKYDPRIKLFGDES